MDTDNIQVPQLIKLKSVIYSLFNVFNKPYQFSEVFLNILFILLIIIISTIIYWDTINRKVSATSRCKRQIDIYDKTKGTYIINARDKSKNPLFDISYDINQRNTSIDCKCNAGNLVNNFNNIPIKDMKTNKDIKYNKTCTCDKYYNIGLNSEDIVYDGEPAILRYINTGRSDFFDNIDYN